MYFVEIPAVFYAGRHIMHSKSTHYADIILIKIKRQNNNNKHYHTVKRVLESNRKIVLKRA
jgi:hypothetical protein